jgi:hypothetical protein
MTEEMASQELPFAETCERNKTPILKALLPLLPARGHVLELGSGTGQHVVHFAPRLARLCWQPSDRPEYLAGLNARIRAEGPPNILPIALPIAGPMVLGGCPVFARGPMDRRARIGWPIAPAET